MALVALMIACSSSCFHPRARQVFYLETVFRLDGNWYLTITARMNEAVEIVRGIEKLIELKIKQALDPGMMTLARMGEKLPYADEIQRVQDALKDRLAGR